MVILLTATVNPGVKVFTKLLDPDIRIKQYIEAINYYLNNTKCKIVVCENSGFDFSHYLNVQYLNDRIEFLTYEGNAFNSNLGKGYGEANIIKYAFKHSIFLKDEVFFIKITGRIKVLNINEIIKKASQLKNENTIMVDLSYYNFAKSVCLVTSKKWMEYTIDKYINQINDSILFHFEKMLYRSIIESPKIKIKKCLAILDGISGTENLPYPNYSFPQIQLNHHNTLFQVYKERKEKLKYLISYLQWLYYIPIRKLYVYCTKNE